MTPRPKVLVVDDLRRFPPLEEVCTVTYARTSRDALALLSSAEEGAWEEIWLDHDLGETPTGLDDIMPVVDLLAELAYFHRPLPVRRVVVHTSNPVGRDTIIRSLERYYPLRPVDAGKAGSIQDPSPLG